MLLVRAGIGPSQLHGYGLFALEDIPQGTKIWQFTDGFDLDVEPERLDDMPEMIRDVLLHYGYIDARLSRFILCCDDARFLNHSSTPNIRTDFSGDPHGVDVAARNIEAGEELTVDYSVIEGAAPSPVMSDEAAP